MGSREGPAPAVCALHLRVVSALQCVFVQPGHSLNYHVLWKQEGSFDSSCLSEINVCVVKNHTTSQRPGTGK